MRILLIDVVYKHGSTGKIVYDLHNYYNSHNYDAYVCYGRGKKVKEKKVFKFAFDLETVIHAFLTRITGKTGCYSYFSTKRLIKYIKRIKPEVVHIHELHAYFVNIKQLLSFLFKSNIRVVFTLHCEFLYTGKCGHSFECEKWKDNCGNCPHLRDYPSSLLLDRTKTMLLEKKTIFEENDNIVITSPSEWLSNRARQSFLKNKRIVTIPNGIDTDIFRYRNDFESLNLPCDNKKKVLAIVPSFLKDNKGGYYLLELAKLNPNINFIIVGVNKNVPKLPDNIVNIGVVTNNRMLAKLYSFADCFLICSHRESFSLTCAESLCCGTRVVGFNSGAVAEVAPYPFGKFCEYGNIKELNRLLNEALKERVNKNDISKYAINKYSINVMAESFLKIYKEKI